MNSVKKNLESQLEYEQAKLKHQEFKAEGFKEALAQAEYEVSQTKKYIKELQEVISKIT